MIPTLTLAGVFLLSSLVVASPSAVDLAIRSPRRPIYVHEDFARRKRQEEFRQTWAELVQSADDSTLQKRVSADVDLSSTLENKVLFDGNSIPVVGVPPITIVCTKCCTKGRLTGSIELGKLTDPSLKIELQGFEAFINLDVLVTGSKTFELTLIKSPPGFLNAQIPGIASIGLILSLNLVLDLSATIDLNGGFFLKLPEDAFIEASIFGGDVGGLSFNGIQSKALPLTINTNGTTATVKAALQLRAEVGVEAATDAIPLPGLPKLGAGAELGVFVNLVELVGQLGVDAEADPLCQLEARESVDLSVGAFLNLDVQAGGKTFGAVPTVSTTLFAGPTVTQCLLSKGAVALPTRLSPIVAPPAAATANCAAKNGTGYYPPLYLGTGAHAGPGVGVKTVPLPSSPLVTPPSRILLRKRTGSNHTATALGPGQTTTVLTLTTCGVAGALLCPASAQGTVLVTQTVCASDLATTTLAPSFGAVCALVADAPALQSLASPVVATLTPRPPTTTTTAASMGFAGGGNATATGGKLRETATRSGGGEAMSTSIKYPLYYGGGGGGGGDGGLNMPPTPTVAPAETAPPATTTATTRAVPTGAAGRVGGVASGQIAVGVVAAAVVALAFQ